MSSISVALKTEVASFHLPGAARPCVVYRR